MGIKSIPGSATLKILLAQYYERRDRKADAIKYYEDALGLDPNNQSLQQDINRLKPN